MEEIKGFSRYKFKFYLNASHSIFIDGVQGKKHPHTWEISIHIAKIRNEFISFDHLEKVIELLLEPYQDKFLNEIEPFNILNPTLENICIYFKNEFCKILNKECWVLLNIEISETPTRAYIIDLTTGENGNPVSSSELQLKKCLDLLENEKNMAEGIADGIINSMLKDI